MPVLKGTLIPLADELIAALHAQGYQNGTPRAYTAAARMIDVVMVRKLRCPGCNKRSLTPHFLHRGERLRIVAMCSRPECLAGEEV
jgi:hypothetical protein